MNVMKTIKFLTTMSAVAVVAIATAVEKPKMNVVPLSADRAVVSITNENPGVFQVSIEDENGDLVYYRESNSPITDYQKIFDFKDLENGNYVLIVRVNDTELSKDFSKSNNQITVGESYLKIDPYFLYKDNVLKFSFLNSEQEHFSLNIYNDGNLIYQKKLGNEFSIQKGFDLTKLEKGEYKVILSSASDEYDFNIVK